MNIRVMRYSSSSESTLGLLFIDGKFQCYTLEDEPREIKIKGKTRIPAGTYLLQLRRFGGHHERYMAKYGSSWHRGMLQVMDVPNFTDILIHKGNKDDDTAGCLLVGDTANNNQTVDGFIGHSTLAYEAFYPIVRDAILNNEVVTITYIDEVSYSKETERTYAYKTVDTERLNLRDVAEVGMPIATLLKGTKLEPLREKRGWTRVSVEGWVSNKYVR